VNPTTWLLYRFAIRRKSARTLELCSGNGAIGLSAAAWSDHVVLTDLNDRAREFAEFSAALNGIQSAQYRIGDSFQPVAGEKFDLILANPPFYVTPSLKFMAVSNELGLDQFCRRLVRQATDHLNDGGFCQMLCEWVEVEGQTWEDRLEEWFDGTGCDAWVVKGNTTKPDKYAQSRIRETFPLDWSSDAPRYSEWMAYYREHKLVAIHRGLIALRKRAGSNWVRIEDSPMTPNIPFGDYIEREFEIVDFMESKPSIEDWLTARLRLCSGVKMTHRVIVKDGKFQPESLEVSSAGGVPRVLKVEPLVAGFLNRLDGSRTLDEMAAEMASNVGAPLDQVRRECVDVARRLYERGFVRAAESEKVSATGTS
jgi:hypothetical protein